MKRSNEEWLADLGSETTRERALDELRGTLLRGLRSALSGNSNVDESFLEDTVQETLLRVLEKLSQFEGRSRFVTWAISIGVRVAMTELRRKRWSDVSLDQIVEGASFEPPATAENEDVWDKQEIVEAMYQVIRSELTDRQRTVLLAELKGMPQEEIARDLGSNRNAIYKMAHDARKRLKKGLEAAGYGVDDIRAAFAG